MFLKVKVVIKLKNKLKFLLGSLVIIGIVNTSYAADYIFSPKVDSEYYYSPTSVNITTIKAQSTNNYISNNITYPTIKYFSIKSPNTDTLTLAYLFLKSCAV